MSASIVDRLLRLAGTAAVRSVTDEELQAVRRSLVGSRPFETRNVGAGALLFYIEEILRLRADLASAKDVIREQVDETERARKGERG